MHLDELKSKAKDCERWAGGRDRPVDCTSEEFLRTVCILEDWCDMGQ
jgi:hypothetical protein